MDGWVGGWMDGWMDGWVDGWVDLLESVSLKFIFPLLKPHHYLFTKHGVNSMSKLNAVHVFLLARLLVRRITILFFFFS